MKMKRIIALLTAMVVAVSCMVGCGADSNNTAATGSSEQKNTSEDADAGSSAAESEEVVELEPATITYWMAASKTEDADEVLDAVNEYLKDVLPNTTLEMVWVDQSEWKDKWSKAMAAREEIDIAWLGWINDLETEVSMGSVMPIDDLLTEYGSGIYETLGETIVEAHRSLDGNLYFLPAWQGMVGQRYALFMPHDNVLVAGDSWAEEFQASLYANEKVPYWEESKLETVALLEEYLEANKSAGTLGLGFYCKDLALARVFWGANTKQAPGATYLHVTLVDDTYYVEATTNTEGPTYLQWKVQNDWLNKGYIREDYEIIDEGNVYWTEGTPKEQLYVNYCGQSWTDDEKDKYTGYAGYQIDAFYLQKNCKLTDGFATGTVIPSTAGDPERAMMLLDLIYTDPTLYQMLVYGIEGTHYTKNADGTITKPENVSYTGPANWQLGTCMNSLETDPSRLNYYQRLIDAEATAEEDILAGFTFDKEPVSIELSNVKAVSNEYKTIWTQNNFEELFKERRDKMITAGIEAVLDEYVDQLTAWAAEKGRKVEVRGY